MEPRYISYMFAKAKENGVPLSTTLELTSKCNLSCRMCYIHGADGQGTDDNNLTTNEWVEIIRSAEHSGTVMVLLTGGEPFLCGGFEEIYRELKAHGMIVSVNTNATAIGEKSFRLLESDPPSKMNISLYGASAQTYGELCGDEGAFDRAVAAIERLIRAGINIKINYAATPYNIGDMRRVFDFAREHKLNIQSSSYMFPPIRRCGEGDNCRQRLSPRDAGGSAVEALLYRYGEKQVREMAEKMLSDGERIDCDTGVCVDDVGENGVQCRAGSASCWITHDGRMLACGMIDNPSVSLREMSFSQAWDTVRQRTAEIRLPRECMSCEIKNACGVCAASCHAETGSFSGLPEYQCEMTRGFIDKMKQLSRGDA